MKKITLIVFFIFINILDVWGQIEIGGGASVQRFPFGNYYGYERSASIYTAAEIGLVGEVLDLAWYANIAGHGTRPVKIYLRETAASQFLSATWAQLIQGATLVYDGDALPEVGWNVFELESMFDYSGGTNNLLVLVEVNSGGGGRDAGLTGNNFHYTTVSNSHQSYEADHAGPVGYGQVNSNRPNLRINIQPPPPCEPPIQIQKSNETPNGVQYNWGIFENVEYIQTEYFLSTSSQPPGSDVEPTGVIDYFTRELILSELSENTRYYIWFRLKCTATRTSDWSDSNTFTTTIVGQIGVGEQLTNALPIQSDFEYNYSQQIYLANEVLEAIGTNRYINKIMFHFTATASTANYKDWKIFMGNTTKDNFGGITASEWVPASTMTTVFDGEIDFPDPTGNWMEITLAEPFLWDGVSNIVVGVHESTPGSTTGANFRRMDTGSSYRGLIIRTNTAASNPDPYQPPAANTRLQFVPQIVLKTIETPSCVGLASYSHSDVTFNSAKINRVNIVSNVLATEYFIGTSLDQFPTATSIPTGVFPAGSNEAVLNNLLPETQYFVWFRNRCSATDASEWSAVPLSFKTLIKGHIGIGEVTTTFLPVYSYYYYSYSQQIYLASEIREVVEDTGAQLITSVKFHINTGDGNTNLYKDWNVYIGNTEKTAFAGTTAAEWIGVEFMENLFDAEVDFPNPTNDWMEITFVEPFIWDGISNIVVAVQQKTPGYTTTSATFRRMDTPTFRGLLNYSDFAVPNPNNPPGANGRYQYVPQIIFETAPLPDCLKPLRVSITDITKNTATINWSEPFLLPGVGYEYEVRTSGLPGTGSLGFTSSGVVANTILLAELVDLLPSTEYSVYMRSRCADRGLSDWTMVVKFTTLCDFPEFTVEEEVLICGQGIVELAVEVTGTPGVFKWYETATGGVAVHEGSIFSTPLITANKSYWVDGTNGEGNDLCLSARQRVNIVVSAGPELNISASTFVICEGEDTELVELITDIANFDDYQWFPETGVQGDFQTGWVFNPVVSTEYVLVAKQSSGDFCQAQSSLWITVKSLPIVDISPLEEDIIICEGDIQTLEVDFIPEFESTIGTAITHSANFDNNTAFNNRWNSGRSQLLFTAEELSENGLSSGEITSLSFNIATPGSALTNANYMVRIATTGLSSFATATYMSTGFTTVYGPSTYTHTESGWQEILFDTPFEWDGVSNLIIEISSLAIYSSNNAQTYYTETANNSLLFSYDNNNPILSRLRYNVIFKGNRDYQVSWNPVTNVFVDEAATIPYTAGASVHKVYYKGQTEGYENLELQVVSGNNCPLIKTFDIRTVIITDAVVENQEFCGVVPLSELVVTGQEGARFEWYRLPTVGGALESTTLMSSGTYYVSQIIGTCQSSSRVPVVITIKDKPLAPILQNVNICGNALLSELDVSYDPLNTLTWYDVDGQLILEDIHLETGIYYVTQRNALCESDQAQVNIVVNSIEDNPIASRSQLFCGVPRVSDLAIQLPAGAVAHWYSSPESTTPLSPNGFITTGVYYGAHALNGCESTERVAVEVIVHNSVALPIVQSQNFCTDNITAADLEAVILPGAVLLVYNSVNGVVPLQDSQKLISGLYYVSQKIGECESDRVRIGINIVDNSLAPNAYAQSFCGEATVADLHIVVATGMIVKWYLQEEGGEELTSNTALQTGSYYVSQSIYYCESPRRRVEVTINDIPASPTGIDIQVFEEDHKSFIADLVLDHPNVVWYVSEENARDDINRSSIYMPLIDGKVYYGVLISDEGCPSLPFAVTVRINKRVGIDDFDWSKLNYYPNPVNDVLTITYKEVITKIEVYSFKGQRVLTLKNEASTVLVDLSRLAPANYVVKIYSNDQSQFIKIIKK